MLVLRVGLMVALLTTILPSPAAASPDSPPLRFSFELDAEPRVGQRIMVKVLVTPLASYATDTINVTASPNVKVHGDHVWNIRPEAGKTLTRAWAITVLEEGLWSFGAAHLGGVDGPAQLGCCVFGISTRELARWSTNKVDLVQGIDAAARSTAWLDGDWAFVNFSVKPRGELLEFGTLRLIVLPHSGQNEIHREGPGDQAGSVQARDLLEEDERWPFSLYASFVYEFPSPDGWPEARNEHAKMIVCSSHFVERRSFGFKDDAVACGEQAAWTVPTPTPAWTLLAAAVGVLLVARGRRVRPTWPSSAAS